MEEKAIITLESYEELLSDKFYFQNLNKDDSKEIRDLKAQVYKLKEALLKATFSKWYLNSYEYKTVEDLRSHFPFSQVEAFFLVAGIREHELMEFVLYQAHKLKEENEEYGAEKDKPVND